MYPPVFPLRLSVTGPPRRMAHSAPHPARHIQPLPDIGHTQRRRTGAV